MKMAIALLRRVPSHTGKMLSGWPDELAFILVSRFSVEFADPVDGGIQMKKAFPLLRRVPFCFVSHNGKMQSGWPDELAFILVSRFSVEFADPVDGGE